MKSIELKVIGTNSINHIDSPVFAGVPFPRGELNVSDSLCIKLPPKEILLPQVTPTAFWPDGSIRWARIDFQCTASGGEEVSCVLSKNDITLDNSRPAISLAKQGGNVRVRTGVAEFHIDVTNNCILQKAVIGDEELNLDSKIAIDWPEGGNTDFKIESVTYLDKEAAYRLVVTIKGSLHSPGNQQSLKFRCDLTFYANKSFICCELSIHNPNAAFHKGGFWDLGDPGSVLFERMVLSMSPGQLKSINWKSGPDEQWRELKDKSWKIHQVSSGGENWQSRNHVIHDGTMPLPFRGFKCYSENTEIADGLRADPRVSIDTRKGPNLSCYFSKFWQNFPSSLSVENDKLEVGFFPKQENYLFELQAGESKCQSVFIGIDLTTNEIDACASFPNVLVDSNSFYEAQAMPWLARTRATTDFDNLIQQGIEGGNSFFEKRERADEYGWRNYGDLWADHETIEHGNDESLVSHYNNQYDPLYSISHQYVLSGDPRWFELFDSLARHLVDIDIYKTDEDRPEYNNGLFWHTDHYLDASTATHRSFSKSHLEVDHVAQSGGGPGDEHCYSTGLAFHYFLTGSERSRLAALKMAVWISNVMDGNSAFLGRLKLALTRDVRVIKQIWHGEKILNHKYPFTRATANYINSMLDSYLITGNREYMERADRIIRKSIDPGDNIVCRNLDDVEITWSYTILLQAIARFIYLKSQIPECDDALVFACRSLIHYVNWMLKNEDFFLEHPERLEYPNSTWVAQDIRKAFLFHVAAQLLCDDIHYRKEGDRYIKYITSTLSDESILKSTRVLAILMQSYGPQNSDALKIELPGYIVDSLDAEVEEKECLTIYGVLWRVVKDLTQAMLRFSPRREYEWLKFRIRS